MLKLIFFFTYLFSVFASFSQVVEEVIQIDTTREVVKVIYKPIIKSAYYFKKVAVFADDTSQIAIEKSYNKFGQNGLYRVFYPSGRLKVKTVFANDKFNGEWTYYDPKGLIIIKGIYEDDIKNGYWAYKRLRIYGRYKKGFKNKKWKRFDKTDKKYLSHYKNGILTGGEGYDGDEKVDGKPVKRNIFNSLFHKKTKPTEPIVNEIKTRGGEVIREQNENNISKEYQQAITFLTSNDLFRRTIKRYFGGSIKKYFKKDKFQFIISTDIISLSISSFVRESEQGKIMVSKIDSLLKTETEALKRSFNGHQVEKNEALYNYATIQDNFYPFTVIFSKFNYQLLRIDVVWNKLNEEFVSHEEMNKLVPDNQKFQMLLYFNNEGVLKGAEYQKH